jgi:heme exporter protein D
METYTDAQIVFGLSLIILFVWMVASYWTKRRLARQTLSTERDAREQILAPVQQENRELRSLVGRLEDRIRVLETIATDPSHRTAREIEELR